MWTDEKIRQTNHEFLHECIIKPWKYYLKTGTLTFGIHSIGIIYKTLTEEVKMFEVPNWEKFQIWEKAKEKSLSIVHKVTGDTTEAKKIKYLREQIELLGYDKAMDADIKAIAYEMVIHQKFEQYKQSGFDVEAYILNWIENDKKQVQ